MMRIAPSSVSRRPASARRRAFTGSVSTGVPARSKRNWTAEATLLTFCPPGPDPLTNDNEISLSGITMCGVTSIGILLNRRLLRGLGKPGSGLEHPQFALRDRYLDAVILEQPPDRAVDVRPHVVHTVHGIGNPEPHLGAHAVVLEGHEPGHGGWVVQDARMVGHGVEQELESELRVIVVTDRDRQTDTYPLIRIAPVDDRVGDQILVRNQGLDPVAVTNDDISPTQFLHPTEVLGAGSGMPGEADDIPRLDGLVDQ